MALGAGDIAPLAMQAGGGRRIVPVVVTIFGRAAIEDHARRDGAVAHAIDDDEGARSPVAAIAVKTDRLTERDGAAADLVELQRRGVLAMQRVDIDLIAE